LTALAVLSLALALLFAGMVAVNLLAYRRPPLPAGPLPRLSVLIPARDEEANIGPLLEGVLASRGVELEVLVLDDGSRDGTAAAVERIAARDGRVRLLRGAPLPPGWIGKSHACWQLARHAEGELLVFLDADVRVAPDALARLAGFVTARRLGLASGFPRQETGTWGERLVIPQIMTVLLGYLPLPAARRRATDPRFAAACGQALAVTRGAYGAAGGHAAIRGRIHDGIALARAVRGAGFGTDLCDLSPFVSCRMYRDWGAVWAGFTKNAREGMATPVALPVWTLLLGGGHVLPLILAPLALASGDGRAFGIALLALALSWGAAVVAGRRTGAGWRGLLAHPLGVATTLAIQWNALLRRPKPVWRGRTYPA
jgi:hypothetical protein